MFPNAESFGIRKYKLPCHAVKSYILCIECDKKAMFEYYRHNRKQCIGRFIDQHIIKGSDCRKMEGWQILND